MSAVVEIFFHTKNVGFFNSKLGRVADANQTIDCDHNHGYPVFAGVLVLKVASYCSYGNVQFSAS